MNKAALRQYIKASKAVHKAAFDFYSVNICKQLEQHPVFLQAQTVLLFYSLPDEPDTHEFVKRWASKKHLLLPVVIGDELELREYKSEEDLLTGAFGIQEPAGQAFQNYNAVNLAVIPGVAFTKEGKRMGRGKGYYDRLLPHLTKAYKLGICFPFQLVDDLPVEPHDILMDEVMTAI